MTMLPRVPRLPVVGNLLQYRSNKIGFLNELRDRYGDLVPFFLGKHRLILMTHPEDIHWVEMKNAKNYVKATNLREWVGDGILMSEGEKWKKQRRLIQPTFHQGALVGMVDAMNRRIHTYIEGVREKIDQSSETSIEISNSLSRLVFEIVGEALFGSELSDEFDELRVEAEYINQFLTQRFHQFIPLSIDLPFPSHLRFKRAKNKIDQTIYNIIDQKQKAIDSGHPHDDLVTKIMLTQDAETHEPMTREQMRDEAISMLLAGFETTGHLLPWILYLLTQNPSVQTELQQEIDSLVGERTPTAEDTYQLTVLSNIIDETLRLYPPVWAWTKRALQNDELRGKAIPAGSILYLSPYLTHRHPKIWDRPNEFIPSRWTTELKEKTRLAYFPFGMGPRTCVGKHFALLEIRLSLIQFFQAFSISADSSVKVEPNFQVTLGMKEALRVKVQRRKH